MFTVREVKLNKKNLLDQYEPYLLPGPLNGKIVVGICYYVSGPVTLQSLASMGALVIKTEQKGRGDPGRKHFGEIIFNQLTYNQLSVAIDTQDALDQQFLHELFAIADVIVDNRSVMAKENDGVLNRYLESDSKMAPLIYCSIDGFPNTKTNRMPGLDASAQACTGLAYTNCFTPNDPLKVGIPILDITTGLLAANNVLANLYFLTQAKLPPETKQVIRIAVSLAGTSVWLQANQFLQALQGKEHLRTGNQDQYAAPFSYYMASDGLISIATVNEDQFKKFCEKVLENSDFHARYPTIQKRVENQNSFEPELNAILRAQSSECWIKKCENHGIPAAYVLTVSQALEQDFIKGLITSTEDGKPIITHGAEHSLFKNKLAKPAPKTIGQDTEKVRSVLSLS